MDFCKDMIAAFDKLPKLVKLILALPALDVVWLIYRVMRSVVKKNTVGIILGLLLFLPGVFFVWLVDMITIAVSDKVLWID